MRISKGLISVVSMASAMLLLCSCTVYDLGLSEGQIEKVISQIENEAQLSSAAASSSENALLKPLHLLRLQAFLKLQRKPEATVIQKTLRKKVKFPIMTMR